MLAFWVVALGLLVFAATGKAEQKLVTIEAPSAVIDNSDQDFAGPVSSTMGPHPGKLLANVLLPDGYTPAKRYPLLLLFHGAGERYDSWADAELGDIKRTAKGLNAVIVMPEGAHGFYTNWWNGGRRGEPSGRSCAGQKWASSLRPSRHAWSALRRARRRTIGRARSERAATMSG